jgi:hypothetical protein
MRLDFTLKVKAKKCRVCQTVFTPFSSTTVVCSIECAIKHTEAKNARLEAKRKVIAKRELKQAKEAIKSRSDWLKDAQTIFNKFIRLRDEHNPCISCGRYHTGQYHAGHYRSVGSSAHLRFSELNCHRQCSVCNNHLSGNIMHYRRGLIAKIGEQAVEQLEADQTPKHYTIDDIKEIIQIYKAKVKELERMKDGN